MQTHDSGIRDILKCCCTAKMSMWMSTPSLQMCEMSRWSMWSLRVPWGWGNHLQRESQRNVGNFQARASVRSHSPRLHDSNGFQSCIKLQMEVTCFENWKMCLVGSYEQQCIIDTFLSGSFCSFCQQRGLEGRGTQNGIPPHCWMIDAGLSEIFSWKHRPGQRTLFPMSLGAKFRS